MAGEMWQLEKTVLGEAIKEGDPKTVKRLISKGENVLLEDRKGNTYIHYVCTMYRPYVINVLLAAGIPINAQNKFGSTALHVTALHNDCCHVPDLMQCGIDPYIKNKDGKTAASLAANNPRWMDLHAKYEPSLRVAVENHDVSAIQDLFGCWCAVHHNVDVQNNRNMRQYAAGLTFHDIVAMIDRVRFTLMAVYSIKECNHKQLEYALSRGPEICDVNFLQQVKGSHPHHMLQHAIRLKDYVMIDMLLEAGADLNVPVYIHEYVRGPLYFEVIQKDHNLDMELVRRIFSHDIDLTARDERGRSALVYCIDRRDGDVTMEMVYALLDKGIDIAMRDNIGCTARDVALFARRSDIVAAIDQHMVDMIRASDMEALRHLAVKNYRDIFINYLNRDTWIFAAGNETDDVTDYLNEIEEYWKLADLMSFNIIQGDLQKVHDILGMYPDRDMLLEYKDKGGRGPLSLAVLYDRQDIVKYLHTLDNRLIKRERDNNNRSVWHYVFGLEAPADFLQLFGAADNSNIDVCGYSPEMIPNKCSKFIEDERKKDYGMTLEVHCINKYEELLGVIESNQSKLKHFNKVLSTVRHPVAEFYQCFHPRGHPLVTGYRDLLHCAVSNNREDIAARLVRCKVDCSHTEQYDTENGVVWMTAAQRARVLGLYQLAQYIDEKGVHSKCIYDNRDHAKGISKKENYPKDMANIENHSQHIEKKASHSHDMDEEGTHSTDLDDIDILSTEIDENKNHSKDIGEKRNRDKDISENNINITNS